jgi:hypothetical protein
VKLSRLSSVVLAINQEVAHMGHLILDQGPTETRNGNLGR